MYYPFSDEVEIPRDKWTIICCMCTDPLVTRILELSCHLWRFYWCCSYVKYPSTYCITVIVGCQFTGGEPLLEVISITENVFLRY